MLLRDCKALSATMDQADRLMNDNPAQAYSLLDSIDRRRLWSRGDKALFALLYTEAQYKNYQTIESDSLIMTSVKYYSHSKNPELLFRSYYMLGCVYTDMHCYSDAIVAFTQADMLNDYCTDQFRKGMLYLRMGDVFYDTYDYARAETYYLKAVDYFGLTDRDYYFWCAKGMVANTKVQKLELKEAIVMIDEIIDWARSVDSLNLLRMYMTNNMSNYIYYHDMEHARSMHDSIITKFGLPQKSTSLDQFAMYYTEVHDFENARKALDKAWAYEPYDSANLYYSKSRLYEEMGKPDSALYYNKIAFYYDKQKLFRKTEQPAVGAQRDYFHTLSDLESLKARNRLIMLISAVIMLILIMVTSALLRMNRKRKTNEQIRNNLYAIDELTARDTISQETIQNLNTLLREKSESIDDLNRRIYELSAHETISKTKIQALNVKVREMLRQQYILPDYLYTRFYEQIDDNKKADRLYKVVKNQIDEFTSPRNIERLDQMLTDTFGSLMDKLFSPQLGLQNKELMLLRLVLTDISAKSMAAILNDTNQNINQRKKRLLEKIGRLDAGLLVELNEALSSK